MDVIQQIRNKINKAKLHADLSEAYQQEVFSLLMQNGIEPDLVETKAENADDLEQAITCYISYGEYSLNGIMNEIKELIGIAEDK